LCFFFFLPLRSSSSSSSSNGSSAKAAAAAASASCFRRRLGFAFRGLALAHFPVIFPSVENQMQPRHHLLDRWQLPGRTGLAARARSALWARLALRSGLAADALRTGLALRPRLAARTFRSGPSGMPLRSCTSGLAARSLRPRSSLSGGWFVGQWRAPLSN